MKDVITCSSAGGSSHNLSYAVGMYYFPILSVSKSSSSQTKKNPKQHQPTTIKPQQPAPKSSHTLEKTNNINLCGIALESISRIHIPCH